MNTKIPEYADILQVLLTMSVVICVGGATLLFLRSGGNRSRRLLSLVMFTWGLIYMTRVIGMLTGILNFDFTSTGVLDVLVLVAGNFFLIVLLLYPLEIVRPGWLNLRRIGLLLLPYIMLVLFYYAVLPLLILTIFLNTLESLMFGIVYCCLFLSGFIFCHCCV